MKNITEILIVGIVSFVVVINNTEAKRFSDDRDIPQWAINSVDKVQESKIMTGFGDGSFRPNKKLNRAEALTLLLRMKGINPEEVGGSSVFSDVPGTAWFAPAVIEATSQGWIKGFSDGTFRPGKTLNKAEWATLVMRVFDLEPETPDTDFDDVPNNIWFARPVTALVKNDLIRIKKRTFDPSEEVTRADSAWLMAKILGMPRILGTSRQNDLTKARKTSSRRVAIKPRDFNAYKQGYDVVKKELKVTAVPDGEMRVIRRDSNWGDVGGVEIINNLDDRAKLHSVTLEFNFDRSKAGPESSFLLRLRGENFDLVKDVPVSGEVAFTGLNEDFESGEEKEFRVFLKPKADEFFYGNIGRGMVRVNFADGSSLGGFQKENSQRQGDFKFAPTGFGNRKLRLIEFRP